MGTSKVKIDDVEIKLARNSLVVEQRIEERSIAEFTVIDLNGSASYARGQPVEIKDPDGTLVFGGFIDTPESWRLSPSSELFHHIICMDNHYLADKRLVVNSYQNKTAGYIVEDIFDQYLAPEGITIGEIQEGPTISEAIFNYVKVSDAYDAIKELSGIFTWFIDNAKKLYFIDRTTNAATWNLDGSLHQAIKGSVKLSTGNPLYRNWQYVWGGTGLTDLQVSIFTGDGDTKIFTLGYPLAKVPTVLDITDPENPIEKSVGIKGIETDKHYYWSKGDSTIYAEEAPGDGVVIQIQYYGQYPLITMSLDSDAIVARKAIEGGTGFVEDIVREAWHESKEASRQSAQAKLTQYCQDAEKFTYQTHESGLAPGQLQSITYAPFGFINHKMLIESVLITANGDLILYDVSCITGPIMGSWSKFFNKLLTRQDKSIRVGGELLLKLLRQEEALDLNEATDLHADLPPTYREFARTGVAHELLPLSEETSYWTQEKGKYCYAPKTNGAGLREGRYGFATYG